MNDFKKEYDFLKNEIDSAVLSCLNSGWYILGKRVEEFEKNFASYTGAAYCIGVANGLEALQIALMACGIGKNDEVITVANTAVATILAITGLGAIPVFTDVDEYYHLYADKIEEKITSKTKAIIPVHLFGQMADMEKIVPVAEKYGLQIIEDACQAHGASYRSKRAGTYGDSGCFSFYPTKNLGAYGDGGAITTNSQEMYLKCKMLRNYGQINRYQHELKGLNSRLDEIQAAILDIKLIKLDYFNKKRGEIAGWYTDGLKDIPLVKTPLIRPHAFHAFHLYVIEAHNRNGLQMYLSKNNIQSLIHYPLPVYRQKCYDEYKNTRLPRTEYYSERILSLPIHPFITEKEVMQICKVIRDFYSHTKAIQNISGDKVLFPSTIGSYSFVKQIMKNRTHRPYVFGLYVDSKGNKAIAKEWIGNRKDFHYYSLNNEINIYKEIKNIYSLHGKAIKKKFPDVRVPGYLSSINTPNRRLMLIEMIDGELLENLPASSKVYVYEKILLYFKFISRYVKKGRNSLTERSVPELIPIFIVVSIITIIKNPSIVSTVLQAVMLFFKNIPGLLKKSNRTFIHRGLEHHNIIFNDPAITILDFQMATVGNDLLELAHILVFSWNDQDFCRELFKSKAMHKVIEDKRLFNMFKAFSVYAAIHQLSTGNSNDTVVYIDFLKYILNLNRLSVNVSPSQRTNETYRLNFYPLQKNINDK